MTLLQLDALESVQLGGITQWIRVRAADAANPVLLLMQQGPGIPIINEVRAFENLGLEQQFTVVYWDQPRYRSVCSAAAQAKPVRHHVASLVSDTVAMLELLHDRFGGKTLVVGFSFGATFAAYAATQRPELVRGLVAVGMDVDMPAAEPHTYDFVRNVARQRNNRRAIRQLEAIGVPPHLTVRQFATRARWAANFGGVTRDANFNSLTRGFLASLVRSRDYSIADLMRTVRGVRVSRAALLPELATTDLVRRQPRASRFRW